MNKIPLINWHKIPSMLGWIVLLLILSGIARYSVRYLFNSEG